MSEGKQPQSPKASAAQKAKNKEAVTECPVCSHPFKDNMALFDCGHALCRDCRDIIKGMAAGREEFHLCPICRSEYPADVPVHFPASLLEVIHQQDADMDAERSAVAAAAADAAAVLLAVRADAADAAAKAAAELLAVRAAAAATAAELAAVLAKQALADSTAAAKAATASMRLAEKNADKERAAAKKTGDSAEQDEIEKSMREVDNERHARKRREREQREEDKDKDWNPKRRN